MLHYRFSAMLFGGSVAALVTWPYVSFGQPAMGGRSRTSEGQPNAMPQLLAAGHSPSSRSAHGTGHPRRRGHWFDEGASGGARRRASKREHTPVACNDDERFQRLSEELEALRVEQGIPGLAVGVVQAGRLTFARGFGSKDPAGFEPVLPTTLFRIASVTKTFTATLVLQLVESGVVTLDEPLVHHLPDFDLNATPDEVPDITVRQLLTHTSGLNDYSPPEAFMPWSDDALGDYLLGPYREIGLLHAPPGVLFSYSNPGYSVLGLLAEEETGSPFRELMRSRVWEPLGMDRSFLDSAAVLSDGDYALGVCAPEEPECAGEGMGSVLDADAYNHPAEAPNGGAWSSVVDLAQWARFLLHGNGRVLGDDLRRQMFEPLVPTRRLGDTTSWGLGLQLDAYLEFPTESGEESDYRLLPQFSHTGRVPGYLSDLWCVPSVDLCLVALANYDIVEFAPFQRAALRLVTLPPKVALPPETAPRPERFSDYVGRYVEPTQYGELLISPDGAGGLRVDAPTLDAQQLPYTHALVPTFVDSFAVEFNGSQVSLTFFVGESGRYEYLRAGDRVVAARQDGFGG